MILIDQVTMNTETTEIKIPTNLQLADNIGIFIMIKKTVFMMITMEIVKGMRG